MKSLVKLLLASPLLWLAACKKNSPSGANLSISGFTAGVFASGDAVTIYGTGFDPDISGDVVLFNGVAGEVATASANRLEVIVPLLIDNGKITVTVHGRSVTSTQSYSIVNVLQGTYTQNFIMTPDKKYMLRGNVIFQGKLIIQAGTVIYGEKFSHGGLTASDIDFEGTAANPIVFTSDQLPGDRSPGDWSGITLNTPFQPNQDILQIPLGVAQYLRVEYAGYHAPGTHGVAITANLDPQSTFKYIQASYSSGDGFDLGGTSQTTAPAFVEHLVANSCWGDDFLIQGTGLIAQYGLGLKDPYNADQFASNSLSLQNGQAMISNFTLVGYNPAARNITSPTAPNNAGAGVQIGEFHYSQVSSTGGNNNALTLYNSVIVGGWQAGVDIYNPTDWSEYEDSTNSSGTYVENVLRNNFFVSTAPALLPFRAGAFGRSGYEYGQAGFDDISATPQYAFFGMVNDTSRVLDFTAGRDDLGLKGLADYNQIGKPGLLPASGSPLLTAASFPALSTVNTPFFDKDITYAGAFGTDDWTASWCNFNPQQTQY